ncbi:MAG: translation initiation factor IF-2 subunit gamma [Candidatus Odinarchaeia archaeon]
MGNKSSKKRQSEVNVGVVGHVDHGKCLPISEQVLINNKLVTGEELIATSSSSGKLLYKDEVGAYYDIPNLYTYTLDANLNMKRVRAILYTQHYCGELIKVRTSQGNEIKVTPLHPFLIYRNGYIKWIPAKDIRENDLIAVIGKINLVNKFPTPNFDQFNHHFNTTFDGENIVITNKRKHVLVALKWPPNISLIQWLSLLCSEGSRDNQIHLNKRNARAVYKFEHISRSLSLKLRKYKNRLILANKPLINYIKTLYSAQTTDKPTVPYWLLSADKSIKREFLRQLFNFEGKIQANPTRILIHLRSKQDLNLIVYLLKTFEILPRIVKVKLPHKALCEEKYTLIISGYSNIAKLTKILKTKLINTSHVYMKTSSTPIIVFDKILQISREYFTGTVFDLSVPKYMNFIAGLGGIVSHNTTLVQAISGEWTDRHSEELKRGISIKLGYADAEILKCPNCPPPQCYTTSAIAKDNRCPHCGSELEFVRRISFVDAPGHEILMATVISGASLMDGAMLVIAANEPCPQPQTREHLVTLEITGVKNIVIVQNKAELVPREKAIENYNQIKEFIKGTPAEKAPIIPTSAIFKANIDALLQAIEELIPTPERDETLPSRMFIARSFDVNKPGTPPNKIVGGVIGGAIIQGKIKVGDEIEIRPGIKVERGGSTFYEPIFTEVVSLRAGNIPLEEAAPGGLIGIGTTLDPSLTKADGLIGNVAGAPDTLPPTLTTLNFNVNLLNRVVGVEELIKVQELQVNEPLMINVGATATIGVVRHIKGKQVEVSLRKPVCAEKGQRIAISRRIKGRWRLIGWGILT